ncbi:hypothetical protein NKI39_09050 [Mesorhizobium sp. M0664]|uniref:hypothetical protein n=1 Tax=Mesorhizobium sp. M0664 TaxID=2956982 RepID=UPI00333BCA88
MPKKYTHTAAFAHFGTAPVNVQWSWSARNEGTKTVAVTLWQDEFKKSPGGRLVYERGPIWADSKTSRGHYELMENLRWALDHCDGWVKVIIAVAKDKNAKPRSIKECAPTKMQVKVMQLDEGSGEFSLEAFGL